MRAKAHCFELKKFQIQPRPADPIRSDPIRADSRSPKTKKARQILTDLSGYLAKPDQRHWWSGKNYDQNSIVPPQLGRKLNIFCAVLQELICVNDRCGHIVHRQPFCHRLAANAFVSFSFA